MIACIAFAEMAETFDVSSMARIPPGLWSQILLSSVFEPSALFLCGCVHAQQLHTA